MFSLWRQTTRAVINHKGAAKVGDSQKEANRGRSTTQTMDAREDILNGTAIMSQMPIIAIVGMGVNAKQLPSVAATPLPPLK